jgi:acetyl-CoA/propionyl-CoA carboxylase biotin carboxyl carrier protein
MRVYAEDPIDFLPRTGTVLDYVEPSGPGVRVDSGVTAGSVVGVEYDPLLAKVTAHAEDRTRAIERAHRALEELVVLGIETNAPLLSALLRSDEFRSGDYDTGLVSRVPPPTVTAPPYPAWIAAAIALSEQRPTASDPPASADPWSADSGWSPGGSPS